MNQHCATSSAVCHKTASHLKLAPHRKGGAGKGCQIYAAERIKLHEAMDRDGEKPRNDSDELETGNDVEPSSVDCDGAASSQCSDTEDEGEMNGVEPDGSSIDCSDEVKRTPAIAELCSR
jgi:hypothetical protein